MKSRSVAGSSSQSILAFLCAAVALALAGPAAAAADVAPAFKGIGIDQHLGVQVPPDLVFRNSAGKSVRLGDYFDGRRPVVLSLVYYKCPLLCPMALDQTVASLRSVNELKIGRDYQVLTISFDPRDKPDAAARKKAHYVKEYAQPGAQAGWHFLTGDQAAIKRLTDIVGYHYRWNAQHQQYVHPAGLMLLTPQGKVSRYFFGVNYEPVDLRLSLVEASSRKIGSLSDEFLLLCCQFDTTTGKYNWAVFRLLNVTGAVLILLVGGLVYTLARRHKRAAVSTPASDPHPSE